MTQITHLKSSIDFAETLSECSDADYRRLRTNNDMLLKQPPTLDMFVPCVDGKVMKFNNDTGHNAYDREYLQAKQRCLFEGFEVVDKVSGFHLIVINYLEIRIHKKSGNCFVRHYIEPLEKWSDDNHVRTISDLTPFNLPLTQTALNKIYQ